MDEPTIETILTEMDTDARKAHADAAGPRNDRAIREATRLIQTLVSVVGRQQRQIGELRGRVESLEAQLGAEGNLNT